VNQPRPFADAVVAYAQAGWRLVQCRYFPDEKCVTCGPDADRWWAQGPADGTGGATEDLEWEHPLSALPKPPKLDSPIERQFWEANERLALPELTGLVAQHEIRAGSKNYRLDFALVAQRIAFELDGFRWHASQESWRRDRRRDLALALIGWRTYRFDGSLVKRNPSAVVRMAAEIVRQSSR